ncbi:MAG: hypothetical protein ACOYL5_16175 [Phototrophicaceae bacterium]|jgi:hypothetical protein
MTDDERRQSKLEGRAQFERLQMRAFWDEMLGVLQQKPVHLLSFDEVKHKLHLRDQVYRGLQEIPLDAIVGSVGRYKDFTAHFLPRNPQMMDRWSNVYAQIQGMTGVPPIEVYKVGEVYFVRDGNHRVSIRRGMGDTHIEAYVWEIHTAVPLSPGMTQNELDAASSYADFLQITRLDVSRPTTAPIKLTEPERYRDVLEHIGLVQQSMSTQYETQVHVEDAAVRWYDTVYRPAIELIRKYKILEMFPKRTEADLYTWIISHLQELTNEFHDDHASLSEALVQMLAKNKIPVPKQLLMEQDDEPILLGGE